MLWLFQVFITMRGAILFFFDFISVIYSFFTFFFGILHSGYCSVIYMIYYDILLYRSMWYYLTETSSLPHSALSSNLLCRSKLNGAAKIYFAAYSCFWPQNQSNSYFDLCQKHEKTSPQNKFSRLVLTGTISHFYSILLHACYVPSLIVQKYDGTKLN